MLDLYEMDVTLMNAKTFRSEGEGGSADGWRRCSGAPGCLPQLPPTTPKNLFPFVISFILFCGGGSNKYSIWTAESNLFFV